MIEKKFNRKLWSILALLLLANLAVGAARQQAKADDYARLYFFDVGQGDAIYFRTAQGNDILIDGGAGDAVLSKLGRVMPFFDRKIELVILTHPQADHTSGLVEVLKRFRVEKVLTAKVDYDTATAREFFRLLEEKQIPLVQPRLGQRVFLDGVTVFDVYYPLTLELSAGEDDVNELSVVGKISYGENQILLTGDISSVIENMLVAHGFPLDSEILKVAHHGSKNSASASFINAVSPLFSVISVGKNSYGHPAEQVLGILEDSGSQILRTDEASDVYFQIYPDKVVLQD